MNIAFTVEGELAEGSVLGDSPVPRSWGVYAFFENERVEGGVEQERVLAIRRLLTRNEDGELIATSRLVVLDSDMGLMIAEECSNFLGYANRLTDEIREKVARKQRVALVK